MGEEAFAASALASTWTSCTVWIGNGIIYGMVHHTQVTTKLFYRKHLYRKQTEQVRSLCYPRDCIGDSVATL